MLVKQYSISETTPKMSDLSIYVRPYAQTAVGEELHRSVLSNSSALFSCRKLHVPWLNGSRPDISAGAMKTRSSIALAVIAGFGLGALSIHTLHAQGKPPVYTIAEIDVSNNDAYMKEYAPKAQALIKEKGGKLIAASNGIVFEGAPAKRVAIQQWETMENAKAWHSSKEYQDNRKIGDKYAKFRIVAVEGRP